MVQTLFIELSKSRVDRIPSYAKANFPKKKYFKEKNLCEAQEMSQIFKTKGVFLLEHTYYMKNPRDHVSVPKQITSRLLLGILCKQ